MTSRISLSEPVLVLNANYEPLNVCTIRRAVGLIVSDKASMIANGRGEIRTVRSTFPIPSIIRLERMIKRPRPTVKLNKQEIFRRDNFTCQYCGKQTNKLTVDHVKPRRLGGSFSWENLVAACPPCNHRKGGRTAEQANMRLKRRPKAPTASANYIFGRYLKRNEGWFSYVDGW
ncbi:MAG: HNH endonuclease [Chloroflexi bacterium]|nr:MAG: HNH endonuclease [Chloroflexota bacterium]MBL1193393.1 HNH endonuclease [Chloroflexota bacterium]NOH10685.1 HNH endonuclease [Chloroflexota bacterium]